MKKNCIKSIPIVGSKDEYIERNYDSLKQKVMEISNKKDTKDIREHGIHRMNNKVKIILWITLL